MGFEEQALPHEWESVVGFEKQLLWREHMVGNRNQCMWKQRDSIVGLRKEHTRHERDCIVGFRQPHKRHEFDHSNNMGPSTQLLWHGHERQDGD